LTLALGCQRPLQARGGKIPTQAGHGISAQTPGIVSEGTEEFAPRRRRPAVIGRSIRLFADAFRIAVLMVRLV
jgi:hypothetical protein